MKRAILLVAFGASNLQGQTALKHFDACTRERFPGLPVRWAFTSCLLRERLVKARKKSDSVLKALQRLRYEQFDHIAVQPLQTIPGQEHGEVHEAVHSMQEQGVNCYLGAPLLADAQDVSLAARALIAHLPPERKPHEDVVFMGHGARHAAVSRYAELARAVHALDSRVHVGAMSGAVLLDAILPCLQSERVWLLPLLSVVGRHALLDMAGRQEDSWLSRIEQAGHSCVPVLKGMAEYDAVARIWLDHLAAAAPSFTVAS